MNKLFYSLILMLWCISVNAQTDVTDLSNETSSLDGLKFEFFIGGGETSLSTPFNHEPFLNYNVGLTVRKDFLTLLNRKLDIYTIAGFILTSRGGKSNHDDYNPFRGKEISTSDFSIPVHAGIEYNFKNSSVFADLGPNLLVRTRKSKEEDLEFSTISTNPHAVGIGFNIGVRFKRFAISMGIDQDVTNYAKLKYEDEEKIEYKGIISRELHVNLRWTLGKP